MRLLTEALGIVLGVGLIVWIASIAVSPKQEKAIVMCLPVHYAMNVAGRAQTAFTNKPLEENSWQDGARLMCLKAADRWLESGPN
jgi:hypothetical protein